MKKQGIILLFIMVNLNAFSGERGGSGGGDTPTIESFSFTTERAENEVHLESLQGKRIKTSDIEKERGLYKLTHVVIKEKSIERVKYAADVLIEENKISNLTYNNLLFNYEEIQQKLSQKQGIVIPLNK